MRPVTFVATLRDEKKIYHISLTKNAGLIKKLVDKSLHLLFNDKSVTKI